MSAPPARTQREFAREELEKELLHDYSTSGTGVVPAGERRSRWHFVALWITLAAGFTYLFLGFEYHRVGYPLAKAVAAAALGAFFYLCYALPASYLGSRTGQTHALLTRSIFGVVGSVLVSLLLIGVAAYTIALAIGLVLFVIGGWMMAEISDAVLFDFGPAYRDTVEFSLFGALWLGAVIATVLQVAINDGNYYEMTNAGQNVLGGVRGWKRWYTCLIMAAIAAVFTWWFVRNPNVELNFFKVAGWSAIALPCTTVVMCVDRFLLPRLLAVERPVEPIPEWRDAGAGNWPAIVAVLVALLFGAWGQGLFPGQTAAPSLGLVPVEAWVLAGALYLALAAVAARTAAAEVLLGFARPLRRGAGS